VTSECHSLHGVYGSSSLLLDLSFIFRPFDSHYEVHRRYILTTLGESFLCNPYTIMSVDPHSSIIDGLLGLVHRPLTRNITQKRGT